MKVLSLDSTIFNAKLDISRVKTHKTRMQNIARLFSDKTMKYSNVEMSIFPMDKSYGKRAGGVMIDSLEGKHPCEVVEAELSKDTWKNLLAKSDEYIAKKLAKALRLCHDLRNDIDLLYDDATKLAKRYSLSRDKEIVRDMLFVHNRNFIQQVARLQIERDDELSKWNINI